MGSFLKASPGAFFNFGMWCVSLCGRNSVVGLGGTNSLYGAPFQDVALKGTSGRWTFAYIESDVTLRGTSGRLGFASIEGRALDPGVS